MEVGAGPAGELRYPSYQLDKWSFCGIGEFQSYSPYASSSLKSAASAIGHPEWATISGPSNAGTYNSKPYETGFFSSGNDNYRSAYGKFFLGWYADSLLTHGQSLVTQAKAVFGTSVMISIKVSECVIDDKCVIFSSILSCSIILGGWYSLVVHGFFTCS